MVLLSEVGTHNFFLKSAIAIPQLEGSTSAIAIPQCLEKCCSTTATPQFRNRIFFGVRNFKSATWKLRFRNFRRIFGREIRTIDEKKIRGKKSCATVSLKRVLVSRETDSSKNTSDWFLNPSWAAEKELDVAELAGDCWKLRNCGSQIIKVRNCSSAIFFSPQFRNRFGSPQYCGVAEVRT